MNRNVNALSVLLFARGSNGVTPLTDFTVQALKLIKDWKQTNVLEELRAVFETRFALILDSSFWYYKATNYIDMKSV